MKKTLLLFICLIGIITVKAQHKDPPPPPPPPPPPKVDVSRYVPPAKELKDFYEHNPDVASLYWKSEKDIVVVHKDKKKFVFNMKDEKEKNAFEEKYGNAVMTTPPPPPPPRSVDVIRHAPPVPPAKSN